MSTEMINELSPLNLTNPDFWYSAIEQLLDNPNKVLPVYLEHPDTHERLGGYYMHIINDGSKVFVQVEDFSVPEIETGFVIGSSDEWKRLQPGIYRFDITKEISRQR